MNVLIAVNWEERELIKKEKYYKMIDDIVKERMNDTEYVSAYLSNNYSISDIFEFTEDQKKLVELEMQKSFEEQTMEELEDDGWEIIRL